MDPYLLVRYFVEFGFADGLAACDALLRRGLDPFAPLAPDAISLFSIAAEKKSGPYLALFLGHWAKRPDWSLHHEAYRLESAGAYDVLEFINRAVSSIKEPHPVANHLLNVLHLTLIR